MAEFNEQTLYAEITKVWGHHGAHAEVFRAMQNEIDRMNTICAEAQLFIRHDPNCGALMGWAKNCSCGYDDIWLKLDSRPYPKS